MAHGRAIGILEVRGMAALTAAADAMVKAADVQVCGRHGIGSGWVTVLVEGDVADVQTAIRVGQEEVARYGELITAEVIARPEGRAVERMPHPAAMKEITVGPRALGMLETQGMAPLIEGADAMVKAANVEIAGWAFIGGALAHVVVRGDVAAVQTSVEVGRRVAEEVGEVHATLVLPQPIEGIGALLPPALSVEAQATGALGLLETTGYAGVVSGVDAMIKAADVEIQRLSIGSGGRIVGLVKGSLDSVQAAIEVGAERARQAGELNAARVISRPDPQVMACFGGLLPAQRAASSTQKAMGLIETRSTVALVRAVDQMLKTAEVEYEGSYKVGYFLTAGVVRGDVGAVRVALDAGAEEAVKHGELVSVHLIPHPYPELEERLVHQ